MCKYLLVFNGIMQSRVHSYSIFSLPFLYVANFNELVLVDYPAISSLAPYNPFINLTIRDAVAFDSKLKTCNAVSTLLTVHFVFCLSELCDVYGGDYSL